MQDFYVYINAREKLGTKSWRDSSLTAICAAHFQRAIVIIVI